MLLCFQADRLEQVKKEEYESLETQSIPLRNYLMAHVMPTLTQGLIDCCKVRPDDSIDYLVRIKPYPDFYPIIIFLSTRTILSHVYIPIHDYIPTH